MVNYRHSFARPPLQKNIVPQIQIPIYMTSISEVCGIDISEIGVTRLQKQAFSSVDFELFPPAREHFLIHAIQFQHKLPSEAAMIRSERRNERKSGQEAANKRVGRPTRVVVNPKRQRRGFVVPAKTLPKIDPKLKKRMGGRPKRFGVTPLVATKKTRAVPRPKRTAFRVKSPQAVALRGARNVCKTELQKWRAQVPPVLAQKVETAIPLYFQKKKASQKRRRQIKHELIKKNRKALVQIYGQAIFQRGWPISIKQIKSVLGIEEKDALSENVQGVTTLFEGAP